MNIHDFLKEISSRRFPLSSEEEMKIEMAKSLTELGIPFQKELSLDKKNRLDFFVFDHAVEVKIKAPAQHIYRQCVRYAAFDQVKGIVLITAKSMGFPPQINGKNCYVINLGRAWL